MAYGSWQSLYNEVVLDLMEQQREKELLLLMAINAHASPFGFCFPGRARLLSIRHCSKNTELASERWLVTHKYITVEEIEMPQFGMSRPLYQISPRVMYVREEFQDYCEAVFDGVRGRDLAWEQKVRLILSSTKDSQPEALPESEPELLTSVSNHLHNQTHNQRAAHGQKKRNTTTMRNGKAQSEAPKTQRQTAQNRKNEPPGGVSGGDEFEALLSPTVDDARLVAEIRHVASTTEYQAWDAVKTYTRASLVVVLRKTARRRERGTLGNPGGWFFTALKKQGQYIDPPGPNGQSTYQD